MQIFKTKWLSRFARRERLSDESLAEAAVRAECGLIDADLGGGLVKLRVARTGQGRSGGYRMLVAFRFQHRAVFLFGFAKNERENITAAELATLHDIAAGWLASDSAGILTAIETEELQEIAS